MATAYETYQKNYMTTKKAEMNKKIKSAQDMTQTQISTIQDNYASDIADAEKTYEEEQRENAVQKKVNEFYISEDMANMGLTNSGLSRMQVTANNLSYANNKAKLDRQRQSMVDSLTREMNDYITQLQLEGQTAVQDIKDAYSQAADAYATEMQKADIEAETERQKAYYSYLAKQAKTETENNYIIKANGANLSRNFVGSLKDNGVTVRYNSNGTTTYTDTKSGKSTTMDSSINPYTGTRNDDIDKGGAFSNGYQPNNYKGNKLTADPQARIDVDGVKQKVWTTNGIDYYFWKGAENRYIKLTESEKKKIGISS